MDGNEGKNLLLIRREYDKVVEAYGEDGFKEVCDSFFENTKPYYAELYLKLLNWQVAKDCRYMWINNPNSDKDVFEKIKELIKRGEDFYINPCGYRVNTDVNRHLCHQECDRCVSKRHWEGIINNRPHHFVDEDNDVYYIADKDEEWGFGGRKYRITLEDGTVIETGLWANGKCTDMIAEQIPKGKKEYINR